MAHAAPVPNSPPASAIQLQDQQAHLRVPANARRSTPRTTTSGLVDQSAYSILGTRSDLRSSLFQISSPRRILLRSISNNLARKISPFPRCSHESNQQKIFSAGFDRVNM